MSQSNSNNEIPPVQCNVCQEMSTWDFIRGFYRRIDMAHQYSRRLEYDLNQVATSAQQSQLALAHCARSLAVTRSALDEERLEHGTTRKALDTEQQSHRETVKLFDLTYEAAEESGQLIDDLRAQITTLQGNPTTSEAVPTRADLLVNLQVTKNKLAWLEAFISSRACRCCEEILRPQQPRPMTDVPFSASDNSSPSSGRVTPTNGDPQGLGDQCGKVISA